MYGSKVWIHHSYLSLFLERFQDGRKFGIGPGALLELGKFAIVQARPILNLAQGEHGAKCALDPIVEFFQWWLKCIVLEYPKYADLDHIHCKNLKSWINNFYNWSYKIQWPLLGIAHLEEKWIENLVALSDVFEKFRQK